MKRAAARWKAGVAALALSIAGPLRADPLGAQGVITRCASQAGAGLTGISALSAACPGLEGALGQLGLPALLPADWRKTLTARELAGVDALVRRYHESSLSKPPGAAGLRAIAASMVRPPPPATWSHRLEAWIRHRTGPMLDQIRRWLRSVSPGAVHSRLAQAVIYGVAALLAAAIAALVTFALRETRLLRPRRLRARPRRAGLASGIADSIEAQSGDPEWMHLRESPSRVLRLLVEALTRSNRLERDRNLTCRELETRARLDTDLEREGFARVLRLAERELYGPPGATPVPEDLLRSAQMLHARLLAAAERPGDARP